MAQLGVWRHLVGARVRAGWQYRMSFFFFLVSQTLVMGLDLGVIAAVFGQVDSLAGWSGVEVALLFGLAGVAVGLADAFVSQVENAGSHIKAGTFDLFLLRPVSPLLHLCASEFELRRIGRSVQPLAVLIVALCWADIHWTVATALLVPVTIASGAVVFGSVWVATAALSFWTVESQEIGNSFTYGGGLAAQYPLELFGGWLRRLFTYIVPLAFVSYVPASRLLGKPTPLGLPDGVAWVAPVVAVVSALAAASIWRLAVRHHQSTGS